MDPLRNETWHAVLSELGGWRVGRAEQVSLLDVVSMILILFFELFVSAKQKWISVIWITLRDFRVFVLFSYLSNTCSWFISLIINYLLNSYFYTYCQRSYFSDYCYYPFRFSYLVLWNLCIPYYFRINFISSTVYWVYFNLLACKCLIILTEMN